jgi:chromosome segregation ATPase
MSNGLKDMTTQWKSACETVQQKDQKLTTLEKELASKQDDLKKEENELATQLRKLQAVLRKERETRRDAEERLATMDSTIEQLKQGARREKESAASSIDLVSLFISCRYLSYKLEHLLADEKTRNQELSAFIQTLTEKKNQPLASNQEDSSLRTKVRQLENEKLELTNLLHSATEQAETSVATAERLRDQLRQQQADAAKDRDVIECARASLDTVRFPDH